MYFKGFGPNSRTPPSDRIKDVYSHGYPSGVDSQTGSLTNPSPGSSSLTDQHPGIQTSNGRGPSSLGSDTFLNRPVTSNGQNGRTNQPVDASRPSILATRRPISNGGGIGKLIDGSNVAGSNSPGSFTPQTGDGGSTTGRLPSRSGSNSNLPSYHGSTSDGSSPGKNQPIRSGSYDTTGNGNGNGSGYPDSGRTTSNNGFHPIDQSRNRDSSNSKQPSDTFDQNQNKPSSSHSANAGSATTGQPSTDGLSAFRNVFKLPPGLCLVRCESLKPGQALTADQIKDAFVSSGLIGKFKKE